MTAVAPGPATSGPRRPSLSVLSPAYRTEDRVARMIDSVRAQTSGDWELVVVDNGMSDEMARIVGSYSHDPRVRLLRQENRGMQGGVNAAAAAARGRHVAVLNSDDQIMPGFCARLTGVLDTSPGLAAVACDAWRLAEPHGVRMARTYLQNSGAPPPDPQHRITLAELVSGVCPYYSGAVRRTVWLEVGGFSADSPAVADLDFWLRLVSAGHDMVAVPEPLGLYSEVAESMSRGARSIEHLEQARERVVVRYATASGRREDLAALARELHRSRSRRSIVRARIALLDGDFAGARRNAAAAVREGRSVRDTAVLLGLVLAPRALARIYSAAAARRGPAAAIRGPGDLSPATEITDGGAP